MLKAATLFTYEIDDVETAIAELNHQLNSKLKLQKNSLGILLCDVEFIESGVMQAVCQAMPFPVVGATTMLQSVNGGTGILMLSMMVITSDDVIFAAGSTSPFTNDVLDPFLPITKGCREAEERAGMIGRQPAMVIVFPPILTSCAGDVYVDGLEKLYGHLPIFGPMACEDSIGNRRSASIYNGKSGVAQMSFALLYGPLKPRFVISALPRRQMMPYAAKITKAKNNIIMEINDVTAAEYFDSIGMAKDGVFDEGALTLPLIVDHQGRENYDGVHVVQTLLTLTKDGAAIARGRLDEGSIFYLGSCNAEDVTATASNTIEQIKQMPNVNLVLAASCLFRRLPFTFSPLHEAKLIENNMPAHIPFMFGHAGGEICPTSMRDGKATNRYHNYSIVSCIL